MAYDSGGRTGDAANSMEWRMELRKGAGERERAGEEGERKEEREGAEGRGREEEEEEEGELLTSPLRLSRREETHMRMELKGGRDLG